MTPEQFDAIAEMLTLELQAIKKLLIEIRDAKPSPTIAAATFGDPTVGVSDWEYREIK